MRAGNGKRRKSDGAGGDCDAVGGDAVIGDDAAAVGKRVGFAGVCGRVDGIVVGEYRCNGIEYVMVRDTGGGYHGYAKEGITQ